MFPTDITILLVTVLLGSSWLSCGSEAMEEKCNHAKELPVMQTMCKGPNEAILQAEGQGNNKRLCKQVILMLKCIAANMTYCYDDFHQFFELYFHSPTYCEMTQRHIRQIQLIMKRGTRAPATEKPSEQGSQNNNQSVTSTSGWPSSEGPDNNGSGAKNGTVTASSSSSSSSSSPPKVIEGGGENGGGGGKGYKVSNGEGGRGSSEEHTGSNSQHPNSSSNVAVQTVLVTIATILTIMMSSPT